MVSPKIKISCQYSREDYAFLKALCIQKGIPFNDCISQALDMIKEQWIQELNSKKNENFFEQVEIK